MAGPRTLFIFVSTRYIQSEGLLGISYHEGTAVRSVREETLVYTGSLSANGSCDKDSDKRHKLDHFEVVEFEGFEKMWCCTFVI